MAQWLSERLGQPFIIENRPGGGGNLAIEAVVKAPADGHTLLLVTIQSAVNATLHDKLNYNFIRDIVPVASKTLALEVTPYFPAKSVPDLIAYTKANSSSADFGRFIAEETDKWGKVIKAVGIKPE